jgi:4-amino-4-deoxy-L-arabinose transferase-like glycosyltransferase
VTRHQTGKFYDAFWYGVTSSELSSHQLFRVPFHTAPTASHPPVTTFLLGAVGFVVPHETGTGQLLTMAVLGAGVVLCVGLLGKAVAGPRVGLVAAALAALAPNFWIPSGILMSETPSMLFMALILLALIRLLRKPTFVSAALVGAACGAQTLVRAELILFVPALLVPGALLVPRLPLRRRFGLLAVGLVATTVVIAPWVGRNLATFKDPTYLSSGEGPSRAVMSQCSRRSISTPRSSTRPTMPIASQKWSWPASVDCGISISPIRWQPWTSMKADRDQPHSGASGSTTQCFR